MSDDLHNRKETEAEQLIRDYRTRFGDDPPYFRFQGAALLDAVKRALETNTPIAEDVPDKGFA